MSVTNTRTAPIVRIPRDGDLPLSFQQEMQLARHWLRNGRSFEIPPGMLHVRLFLKGRVNVPALELALNELVRRHEILRTTYALGLRTTASHEEDVAGGTNMPRNLFGRHRVEPRIHPASAIGLRMLRVQAESADRDAGLAELARIADEDGKEPFRPDQVPMIRCTLVRVHDTEHLLLVTLPNVISDYSSRQVIRYEIETLYDQFVGGSTARLPDLPLQYVDFAAWQRRRFSGDALDAVVRFWAGRWHEFRAARIPYYDLPFARAADVDVPPDLGAEFIVIAQPEAVRVRRFVRLNGSTMYLLGLTAFHVLVHGYTGRDRLATLSGVGDRAKPGTEALIGLFTNAQLLGVRLSPDDSVRTFLDHVRDEFVAAEAHAAPAELLRVSIPEVSVLHTGAEMAFDFFDNRRQVARALSDGVVVDTAVLSEPATGRAFLNFLLVEFGHELRIRAQYRRNAFRSTDVQRVLEDYKAILMAIVERPDERISTITAPLASAWTAESRA